MRTRVVQIVASDLTMGRVCFAWTVLMISLAASPGAAQQGDEPSRPPAYADAVSLERIRQSLAAPPPKLVPLRPAAGPTFKVQVFGRKPYVMPFDEWLKAELADSVRAAK